MGISLPEWERMTPVELNLYAEAYGARQERRQKLAQANIYALATLIRSMVWAKKPPSYEESFPEHSSAGETMTDEQMYTMVRGLNALFGGKEDD